jgi:hypothetical protein
MIDFAGGSGPMEDRPMTTPKSFIVSAGNLTAVRLGQEYVELSVDRDSFATPVQISIYPADPTPANAGTGLSAFLTPDVVDQLIDELVRIRELLRPESVV